jgi:type IV secretion system protein TrbF
MGRAARVQIRTEARDLRWVAESASRHRNDNSSPKNDNSNRRNDNSGPKNDKFGSRNDNPLPCPNRCRCGARAALDFVRSCERSHASNRVGTRIGLAVGVTMPDSNPYIEARREWNDRYLELVRERRLWQIVAGVELVVLLIVGIGFVWLSVQHKIVPYVVEVDSLGAALAIRPAEPGGRSADERIVRYQLAAFVRGARQVMTDRIAMKKELERVDAYARGPARTVLDDYYHANNPFEIAKTYVVVPAVTSLLRLSPTSWQMRWTEEQRELDGLPLGKSQWEGVVTTEIAPPTSEDEILVNPLGLYVTDLRWTKQL